MFLLSLSIFIVILRIDNIKEFISYYYCPLGNNKHKINDLKTNEKNLKLIKMIELKDNDIVKNINCLNRIAEDNDYEYYVKKI